MHQSHCQDRRKRAYGDQGTAPWDAPSGSWGHQHQTVAPTPPIFTFLQPNGCFPAGDATKSPIPTPSTCPKPILQPTATSGASRDGVTNTLGWCDGSCEPLSPRPTLRSTPWARTHSSHKPSPASSVAVLRSGFHLRSVAPRQIYCKTFILISGSYLFSFFFSLLFLLSPRPNPFNCLWVDTHPHWMQVGRCWAMRGGCIGVLLTHSTSELRFLYPSHHCHPFCLPATLRPPKPTQKCSVVMLALVQGTPQTPLGAHSQIPLNTTCPPKGFDRSA